MNHSVLLCEKCGKVAAYEQYANKYVSVTKHNAKIICIECYNKSDKELNDAKRN